MKLNILVTATGSAIGQGIIKSIKGSSLDCNIVSTDSQPYAAGLYRGKAAYLVPLAKSSDFVDSIIKIGKKENIHAICIGTDYELSKFSENKKLIENETGAKVIVSSPDVIKVTNDKWLTYNFLVEHNLPHIPSVLHQDADLLIEQEDFPLIIKPRIGDSSKNTFLVNNKKELNEKIKLLLGAAKDNPFVSQKVDPIIQKYVGNVQEEYTSTTLVFDRRSLGVITMKREMKFGGHTTKAIIEDYPLLCDIIKKVAEVLNPFGPCNFQSRVIDGIPHIFEINCRFSGTTAMCSQVGFNTVEACLRKVVLDEKPSDLTYKKGVFLRYFNEVFVPQESITKIKSDYYLQNPKSEINKDL